MAGQRAYGVVGCCAVVPIDASIDAQWHQLLVLDSSTKLVQSHIDVISLPVLSPSTPTTFLLTHFCIISLRVMG